MWEISKMNLNRLTRSIAVLGLGLMTAAPVSAQNLFAPVAKVNESVVTEFEVQQRQRFLEVFEMRRPRSVRDAGDLRHHAGARLHMRFRSGAPIGLKGVLMPAPGKSGGLVVNLSFGISVVEAVREFSLTGGDFAATDLTIEMLYLVEAKSAAMEASRKLNQKLEGAKIAAEEQAFTDTLTGLKNRRAMDHVLARLVAGPG